MEKGRRKTYKGSEAGFTTEEMKKAAVKPRIRKRSMRRRTACVMAAALILQGTLLPAWTASAEELQAKMEAAEEAGESTMETSPTEAEEIRDSFTTAEPAAEETEAGGEEQYLQAVQPATASDAMSQDAAPSNEPSPPATESNARPQAMVTAMALMTEPADPWAEWNGKTDYPGSGTEKDPYCIEDLSHLMGLSKEVAGGNDFAGKYIVLTAPIDLASLRINGGSWNPIGWYWDADEMEGEIANPFRGHFDGQGNTIKNLRIERSGETADYAGLFGLIDGGSVKNLKVEAGNIVGSDHAAVLAAEIRGGAVIRDVTVSGKVFAEGKEKSCAGGITAVADGSSARVIIENCSAGNVAAKAEGPDGCTGGIAGQAVGTDLVDNTVSTWNSNSNNIQGLGYVGGIAGSMEDARIYNSYVDGLIGGHRSRAVGGIVGEYVSGDLILARFAGETASTGMSDASREGTFIGTRKPENPFSYGTEPGDNLAFLFAREPDDVKRAVGSCIANDNTFSYSAHVGYWEFDQRTVWLLSGNSREKPQEYFYQELEAGVNFIMTAKLKNEFVSGGQEKEPNFRLDHFAPGTYGQPVKGYLLSVPRIDTKNAGATYDKDVAVLTAMPEGRLSYYRTIDKNSPAAVEAGVTVSVSTSPKNSDGNRYQMAADPTGHGVKPPVYINERGEEVPMHYVNGGTYTFTMPARDTQINVEYVKVTTELTMTPAETEITVTQTRTGDRKAPDTVTEIHDAKGKLIARYIDGAPDQSVQVLPVRIHSEHNSDGIVADRTVNWSVDDTDLISLISDGEYTEKDVQIMPRLNSTFIQKTLEEQVKAQADGGYLDVIKPTVYERHAVVTAASNPATSADQVAVYGSCKVTVKFRILDLTTRRVEGLQLNKSDIVLTVTRKLTGSRTNPTETITCSEPVVLAAGLYPEQPFYKNVSWSDRGSGSVIILTPQGANASQCAVTARFDPAGKANPAWIQNVINGDNQKKKEDASAVLAGRAEYTETVTALSEDQTHGVVSAACRVTVRFVTVDQTSSGSTVSSGHNYGSYSSGSSSSSGRVQSAATVVYFPDTPVPGAAGIGVNGPFGNRGTTPLTGSWLQTADGCWTFTVGQQSCRSQWAYIFNSYADTAKGQSNMDWFYFDADGYMVTGWRWIKGSDGMERCYYFNEQSDGTKGAMLHGGTIPDGWQVDADGAWTLDGVVQLRQPVL